MLPEDRVKKLAKLPGNCTCPNCGSTRKFGFGNVCMLSLAFVCNECKSSHQAISHRCKSLTMSSWTETEVLQLTKAGNDVCRNTWLARAPPCGQQGRPQPGMDIMVYKRFIEAAYERKVYFSAIENGSHEAKHDSGESQEKWQPSPSPSHIITSNRIQKPAVPLQAATAPVAVADLLDFGAFEIAQAPAKPPPADDWFAAPPVRQNDFTVFDASAPAFVAPTNNAQHSVFSHDNFDPLAGLTSLATRSLSVSEGGNIGSKLAGFATISSDNQPPHNVDKKPIMEMRNRANASLISAMESGFTSGGMAPPQPRLPAHYATTMQTLQSVAPTVFDSSQQYRHANGSLGMVGQHPMNTMAMNGGVVAQQPSNVSWGFAPHHQPSAPTVYQVISKTVTTEARKAEHQLQSVKPDPFAQLLGELNTDARRSLT
jgi:hypothetical protein